MITVREKISNMIESLPENEFLQVHKSFAIAKKHIKSIEGYRVFIGDYKVPIGKLFKSNVNKLLK